MPFANHVDNLIVADNVHVVHSLHRLERFDADESLTQGHRTEAIVEIEQSLVRIYP